MSTPNHITKIALVGATGHQGTFIATELLKTGKHTLTALTRGDNTDDFPKGIHIAKIDYDDPSTIVAALKGQDALIITMGARAPPENETKLIHAAAEAGVGWVLPNIWSPDTAHEALCKDFPMFAKAGRIEQEIVKLGKSSYLSINCGFWLEWSLAIPPAFGFDIQKREVTFFDEGKTKMSVSTWPQVGRAVAALLSLPVRAEGGKETHCLDHFRNKNVYIKSFTLSQRDMLESIYGVTGTKEADWTFHNEASVPRFEQAMDGMKKGDYVAFVQAMYTRVFYQDDTGNYEKRCGVANEVLGLPKESLDDAVKVAVERSEGNPYA
ncbi:hypothetical protein LTR62_008487 [Meristemomyces frigidus]|uniref:NmrA-like domain-containing protein n=1 Tax=Meristemomyces frigidus TaxID=1508187 RepID=A0AAN7TUA9_9PEZI|nr:hypothetical protein LTR62_008487 [Meristemomyces frigidus]